MEVGVVQGLTRVVQRPRLVVIGVWTLVEDRVGDPSVRRYLPVIFTLVEVISHVS